MHDAAVNPMIAARIQTDASDQKGIFMASTIFERYGGFSKVRVVVSDFYDRVLDSDVLSPYFDDVNMRTQIDHQIKFMSQVMGGPAAYTDEVLQRVHAPLGISKSEFIELATILRETLEDLDFDSDDVDMVIREVSNREAYIVARKS